MGQFIAHVRQQQPEGELNFRDALNRFTREQGELLNRIAQ